MPELPFTTILSYAAKLNELRKANPEAFKALSDQTKVVIATFKSAMADDKLTPTESLQIAADACIEVERA